MTVIILQVMNTGIYASVDDSLRVAKDNINQYVDFQMDRQSHYYDPDFWEDAEDSEGESERPFKPSKALVANTEVVFYNAAGVVLDHLGGFRQVYDLPLDDSELNTPIPKRLETYLGREELYRTMTVRVSNLNYPEVAFATILINAQQLENSQARSVKIIVSVMIFFWVLSLFASIYLAEWTRKPILESFERQKTFVENASHELRTPLAVLQNRLESLFRKPDETILDNSERIAASLEEVRNMKLLTTNLLNLARRDDGLAPEFTLVEPVFFDDIFGNYRLVAEEQGKTFMGDNKLTRPIKSDKVLLKQLLTILFDNAIKYTGPDGYVYLVVRQQDKQLEIDVLDNGVGISDGDKAKIFDRFYRVDKARTRQSGGFGLGLALAKQIVDSLNGDIRVQDNQPRGSVFEVRLPL